MPQPLNLKKLKLTGSMKTYKTLLLPQNRCSSHHRRLECKITKSRDTWNNKKFWPWSTKWSRAKTNSFVKRMHWSQQTPASNNTRDNSMDITRWSIPKSDWLYSLQPKMEKLYTVSKNKTGSWLWLSDHELLTEKLRLQMRKVKRKPLDHSGMT